MNKEECLEALNDICKNCVECEDYPVCDYRYSGTWCKKYDLLLNLINEYFDTSSLKFEELIVGTWVWCDFLKYYIRGYIKIEHTFETEEEKFLFIRHGDVIKRIEFEENHFFKKEIPQLPLEKVIGKVK